MKAQIEVLLGRVVPTPISAAMVQAIESIEVRQVLEGRATFQLVFRVERAAGAADFDVLSGIQGRVMPSVRTIISAAIGGSKDVLMDGYITSVEVTPSDGARPALVTATGEDVSVRMDLVEHSTEWPCMTDYVIANAIILSNADLALIPLVVPAPGGTLVPPNPIQSTPFQQGTDYQYLLYLAQKYGYTFRVYPGPVAGTNYAYWGPIVQTSPVRQTPLTVGTGVEANVQGMVFSYDGLQPHLVIGEVYDDLLGGLPLVTVPSPIDPCFYAERPPIVVQPLFFRTTYRTYPAGGSYLKALAYGMGEVLASQMSVATASGRLDVFRYGGLLRPYEAVGVRGAGASFDGYYFVTDVTHHIRQGVFTQEFRLARGGLGSLYSSVGPVSGPAEVPASVSSAITEAETVVSGLDY